MTAPVAADSLRAVLDTVFAAPKYTWVSRMHPAAWLWEQFLRLMEWFESLRLNAPAVYWSITAAAVIVLVVILVHAGWLMARTIRYSSAPDARLDPLAATRRDGGWYRKEATRLARSGRFPEAMRAWFEGIILDLSVAGVVRWHPSKTPREYVREAKLPPEVRDRLAGLVDGLYAASFAGHQVGDQEWREWRERATGGWRAW